MVSELFFRSALRRFPLAAAPPKSIRADLLARYKPPHHIFIHAFFTALASLDRESRQTSTNN